MRFLDDYVGLKLMEHQVQTSVNEHELSSETTAQQRSRRKQVVQLMILMILWHFFCSIFKFESSYVFLSLCKDTFYQRLPATSLSAMQCFVK